MVLDQGMHDLNYVSHHFYRSGSSDYGSDHGGSDNGNGNILLVPSMQ